MIENKIFPDGGDDEDMDKQEDIGMQSDDQNLTDYAGADKDNSEEKD